MAKGKPSHAEAQLHLQLYDLRREAKLRAARDWFAEKFSPQNLGDANRLAPPGSQETAYMRMVVTYWEMVCQLFNQGLLNEELLFHTSGEFYLVWDRVQPIVASLRERYRNPLFFAHLEKTAKRYQKWIERRAPGSIEAARQLQQQARAAAAQTR